MNEVWHARDGIVARGGSVVESGPDGEDLAVGTWLRLEALPDPRLPVGGSTRWPTLPGDRFLESAGGIMEPLLLTVLMSAGVVLIAAVTAVLVVRLALKGTESRDRAAALNAVADIIRAIIGRPLKMTATGPRTCSVDNEEGRRSYTSQCAR